MTIYEIKAYGYNKGAVNNLLFKDKEYAMAEIYNKYRESKIHVQNNINQIVVDTNSLLTICSIIEREVL